MNRLDRFRRCSLGVAVALVALAGAAAAQDRPPASVLVAQAQVRELAPTVRAAGLVRSRASADLAASVAGRLQWIAEPGTAVAAGALVARLDTRELSLARAEQAARVNRASVNLKSLERELDRLKASGNAVSRFNVDQAQSNRDLAAADLEVAPIVALRTWATMLWLLIGKLRSMLASGDVAALCLSTKCRMPRPGFSPSLSK